MEKKQIHYAWFIMISCCAIMITGIGINNSCAGIFIKPVSESLGVGVGSMSSVLSVRALAMMFAMPFAGKIMQKKNLRVVLSLAFLVQMGSFAAYGLFHSLLPFYICGAITGVASAFICYIPVPMLLNNWFSKNVGSIMGITMAFSGLGGAVFNPVGNFFIDNYGWRAGYFALGLMGFVIVAPFTIFVIRRRPSDMGLQPYGTAPDAVKAEDIPLEGVSAKQAFRTPAFFLALLFSGAITIVGNFLSHMSGLAQDFGFDSAKAAMAVSVLTIGVVVGKIVVGNINDRIGIGGCVTIAVTIGLIGTGVLVFCSGSMFLLYLGAFLLGMSIALPTLGPPLLVTALFGNLEYTNIYSVFSSVTALSSAISLTLYGLVVDLTGSYFYDLVIVGATLIISLVSLHLALRQGRKLVFEQQGKVDTYPLPIREATEPTSVSN